LSQGASIEQDENILTFLWTRYAPPEASNKILATESKGSKNISLCVNIYLWIKLLGKCY